MIYFSPFKYPNLENDIIFCVSKYLKNENIYTVEKLAIFDAILHILIPT
jgi:hypothetical protein